MSQNKALAKLMREIRATGHTIEQGRGHMKIRRDGKFVYSLPSSPGRGRWEQNARATLRRLGILPRA